MIYTKEAAVEQVFLAVNGGELSPDLKVERVDIEFYLAACINHIIKLSQDERRELQLRERRAGMHSMLGGIQDIETQLTCTFSLSLKKDEVRELFYSILPTKLSSLHGKAGIKRIYPAQGTSRVYVIDSRQDLRGMEEVTSTMCFAYPEKIDDEDRVYFIGVNNTESQYFIQMIADIKDLDSDATLPIPTGYEKVVIDMTTEFFLQSQKAVPEDVINIDDEDKQV